MPDQPDQPDKHHQLDTHGQSSAFPVARRPRPRIGRFGLLVMIGGTALLVLLAFRVSLSVRAKWAVERYRAAGHPVTVAELIAMRYPPPPEADNGVPLLKQAMAQYIEADDETKAAIDVKEGDEALTSEQIAQLLHEHLRANEPAMTTLREALEAPDFHWGNNFSDPFLGISHEFRNMRSLALLGVLEHRMHRDVWSADQAVQAIEQTIRLSETLAREPDLLSQLVRTSIVAQAMKQIDWFWADHQPEGHLMDRLAKRLATVRKDLTYAMRLAFEGEMVNAFTIFRQVAEQSQRGSVWWWHSLAGTLHMDRAYYVKRLSGMIRTAGVSDLRERVVQGEAWDQQPDPPHWAMLTRTLMPSLNSPLRLNVRMLTTIRTVELALTIERRHLQGDGLPESLDELAPDDIDAVPTDPFGGQPLRYIRLDDGYVIYSVGDDGTDDGGAVESPEGKPPLDIGLRIQRPDLRGVGGENGAAVSASSSRAVSAAAGATTRTTTGKTPVPPGNPQIQAPPTADSSPQAPAVDRDSGKP